MSFDHKRTHWMMPERGLWTPPGLCSLMSPAALGIFGRVPGFAVDAAAFDGVNDYLQSVTALSTAADSNEMLFSAWYRFNSTAGDGVEQRLFSSTANNISIFKSTGNTINVSLLSSTGGLVWGNAISTGTLTSTSGWAHLLITVDTVNSSANLYINGLESLIAASTVLARTIDFTWGDWSVGAAVDASAKSYVDMAEVYFNVSTDGGGAAAMLSKFRVNSKPISLGPTGSLPTGADPIMYLHLDDGESAANFANNPGSGSTWTIVGALAASTSSPTD